ncbi:hypothetical protein [Halorussus marinus]|uniref:hypothetical protein n=1 Tax=Halorussus marinus TaxID=2505976 RepID=UPI00106E7B8E|nr:hypothetical protein [Halorussus marinus]
MMASILGLPRHSIDLELETDTDGHSRGIVVNETQYLDGVTIYHGTAAGTISAQDTDVIIADDAIFTEQVEANKTVATEYIADFDAGFVGIDTSDGTFLWETLSAMAGVDIVRAEFNLDAFAEQYERRDDASVWQIGYKHDEENVGVRYHDDAQLRTDGVTQLGFQYLWDGQPVRGTVAASGYAAVYSPMHVEEYGRWVRDELLPYAFLPEDGQEEFTESDEVEPEVGECEKCGREADLEETGDGMLCVVCADKLDEESSQSGFESLDSVTVADGGQSDE